MSLFHYFLTVLYYIITASNGQNPVLTIPSSHKGDTMVKKLSYNDNSNSNNDKIFIFFFFPPFFPKFDTYYFHHYHNYHHEL